jgi:hypothetical protein
MVPELRTIIRSLRLRQNIESSNSGGGGQIIIEVNLSLISSLANAAQPPATLCLEARLNALNTSNLQHFRVKMGGLLVTVFRGTTIACRI